MKVLSVGQCSPDDSRIAATVHQTLGASMDRAASPDEAAKKLTQNSYDLILVNRIFDYGGDSGLDFIQQLKQSGNTTPTMLVSNYQDAQAQAIAHGALPGFGKSALGTADLANLLRNSLKSKSQP